MFHQMTRRSKDYKQSLIQRKLEEKTNSYTIPFLVSCFSWPILRMPVPVMLSTCAMAVFSTEPWNLWILSNQSTSSIVLSCGHTAKELKERVDVWGAGVEGGWGGNMAYWLTHQTVNPVARVWLLDTAGQRTCSILLSQNLFRFISLPCFFVRTACTKIVVHVIDPMSTFSRHNDQWHVNTQTMHNSSRITSDVCGCSWWK